MVAPSPAQGSLWRLGMARCPGVSGAVSVGKTEPVPRPCVISHDLPCLVWRPETAEVQAEARQFNMATAARRTGTAPRTGPKSNLAGMSAFNAALIAQVYTALL